MTHTGVDNFDEGTILMAILDTSLFEYHAVDIHLFDQFWLHGQKAGGDLAVRLYDSWRWMIEFKLFAFCSAVGAGLLVGAMFFFFCKRFVYYLIYPSVNQNASRHVRFVQAQRALIKAIMPTVVLLVFFVVTDFLLDYNHITSPSMVPLYQSMVNSLIMVTLLLSGRHALLSCHTSNDALIRTAPNIARRNVASMFVLLLFIQGHDVIDNAVLLVDTPTNFRMALRVLMVVTTGFIAWYLLPRHKKVHFVRATALLISVICFLLALAGYASLSQFIIKLAVISAVFLPTIVITFIISRTLMDEGVFAQTLAGRALMQRFDFSAIRLDQFGLVLGVSVGGGLLTLIIAAILLLCGISVAAIATNLLHLFVGIQIGSVFISPFSLLIGFVFFLASLFLCRWLVKMFDGVVLAHGHIDTGVRHSIRTVSGYASLALAGIIGVSAAGFNLSSLALIAGGLSLGIGFGMQNIIQNFVSGLILLVARPFKVGDFIEIGSVCGHVRQINVRATKIETLERRFVIVPNSSFISNNVSNWTLHGSSGQITMSFTLPVDGLPDNILNILLELAGNIPQVLPDPPPEAELVCFDDKKFTFSLHAYIADIKAMHKVKTALNLAVYEHFFYPKNV